MLPISERLEDALVYSSELHAQPQDLKEALGYVCSNLVLGNATGNDKDNVFFSAELGSFEVQDFGWVVEHPIDVFWTMENLLEHMEMSLSRLEPFETVAFERLIMPWLQAQGRGTDPATGNEMLVSPAELEEQTRSQALAA